MKPDAKQLIERFNVLIAQMQAAVSDIEQQVNTALAARDARLQALEDRIKTLEQRQ